MSELVVDVGTCVRLKVTLTDPETREPAAPDLIVATVRPPGAAQADFLTIDPEALEEDGEYLVKVLASKPGRWYVAIDTAGAYTGAKEASFVAREQYVPR